MPDVNIDNSALDAAVALGQKIGQPVTCETVHYAVVPTGTEVKSLKDLQYPHGLRPDRIIGTVQLRDAVSFCRYHSLFADDRSRVFAEPKSNSFLSVLDYHGAGERHPEFLSHKASFAMTLDERWTLWASKSEKQFSQVDFAEFIEDNNADIVDPSGAAMLEVARDLKASSSANFESKVTPKNGQVQIRFSETIDAKVGTGSIEVPEFFKIAVPVFYGEDLTTVTARLRYRINSGNLTFHFKLYRQSEILQTAFNKAVASISDTLKCDVLLGSPA